MGINKKIMFVFFVCLLFFIFGYLIKNRNRLDATVGIESQMAPLVSNNSKVGSLEVERISKNYYKIDNIKVIEDKIGYRVTPSKENNRSYIIYDGKEVGKEYYSVGDFMKIGKDLCFSVFDENYNSFWVCGNSRYGEGYSYIYTPININGKPAFLVREKNKMYILYDNKEIGKEYDDVTSFIEIDGELAYVAKKDNSYFLVKDGVKTGNEYPSFFRIKKIKNNLLYEYDMEVMATSDAYTSFLFEINGIKVSENYDYVYSASFLNINNKIIYSAIKGNEYIVVDNGVEIYKEKNNNKKVLMFNDCGSHRICDINTKLVYLSKNGNKTFIVYDGKEIGKEYDSVNYPIEINGKLTYIAKNGDKTFIVYDGKEIGKEYDSVNYPIEINEKLMYLSKKDNKNYIIYNNKEIKISDSHSFDRILNQDNRIMYIDEKDGKKFTNYMASINGKIVYIDEKDGKSFVVIEK